MEIIEKVLSEGRTILSEYESKQLLAAYGIPVSREAIVLDKADLMPVLHTIGYPMVLKGCSPRISHKTEQGVIHVDIRNDDEALAAYNEILSKMDKNGNSVLVQEMVKGQREVMAGLTRDPQFGPCVMFGLGGIFTEILKDVSFRLAPLERRDALDMMLEIKGHKILDAIRGMEQVNRQTLGEILIALGRIGLENERIKEIDVNPLIIRKGEPVAVDALVVLE
ncbi:MAG TPA: acetate--CoA ligase family protein [Desulfomonilaceae bacterium]|nr:acetate--CoA ligase family protein [Desulfomonilaceae bacterium]